MDYDEMVRAQKEALRAERSRMDRRWRNHALVLLLILLLPVLMFAC